MTLRSLAVGGSILAALTLAACGDDDEDDTADVEPVAEAEAPVLDAEPPAMEAEPPAMEAEPPAMDAEAAAPVFGTDADIAYAADLWAALESANLVGDLVLHGTFTQAAAPPHGTVIESLFVDVTVDGTTAVAIIKRNYGPAGVAIEEVSNNPGDHLMMITVMYQRPGFNADTDDWFWVNYQPDGTLNLAGETQLAGNVGGCIACHGNAPGGDWVYLTDRVLSAPAAP